MIPPIFQTPAITLYQGDCLAILPQIPDNSIRLLLTDPPYGNNNATNRDLSSCLHRAIPRHTKTKQRPILNDTTTDMQRVVSAMLDQTPRILRHDSAICCCCGGGGPKPLFAWLANRLDQGGLAFFHAVVWDKIGWGLGWRYRRSYEFVMVAHRRGGRLAWAKDRPGRRNIIRQSIVQGSKRVHPNEKPMPLMEEFILNHTDPGDTVLDPFCGSGVTLAAALKHGRKAIGIELSPRHIKAALARLVS